MIYRHKVTGVTIDVESTMSGDWEPVKATGPARAAKAEQPEKQTTEKAVKKNGRAVRNDK